MAEAEKEPHAVWVGLDRSFEVADCDCMTDSPQWIKSASFFPKFFHTAENIFTFLPVFRSRHVRQALVAYLPPCPDGKLCCHDLHGSCLEDFNTLLSLISFCFWLALGG